MPMAAASWSERLTGSDMKKPWLIYALITTGFWGVWGAFAEFPTRHGFPETLVYVVWALTMIPPALYAMRRVGWRVQRDSKSILLGSLIGLTGAGGQMLLFHAVHTGPTYLIFPIIALSPVVTILSSSVSTPSLAPIQKSPISLTKEGFVPWLPVLSLAEICVPR